MKDYDPLTVEEVNEAAKEFFPMFDIVHRQMPENCLNLMEQTCVLSHCPLIQHYLEFGC